MVYACQYVHVCACATYIMVYVWRSEVNLWEPILSFHRVSPPH